MKRKQGSVKLQILISIILILLVLGATIVACSTSSESFEPGKDNPGDVSNAIRVGHQKGKLAPDFALRSLDGQEVTLSGLLGKPVLIFFWATWCGQCRSELSQLKTIHEDYKDQELVILALNSGESASRVRDFVASEGIPLTVLLDRNEGTARSYRIAYLPTNFLIDKQGIIKEIRIGRFSSTDDLEESLGKIL